MWKRTTRLPWAILSAFWKLNKVSASLSEIDAQTLCPHCGAPLARARCYCAHCGRRAVDFQYCDKCDEPVSSQATWCPYCSRKFVSPNQVREILKMEISASNIGALFAGGSLTGLFLPPTIRIHDEHIIMKRWTLLGARCHEVEIQIRRVASVRYTKGVIWAELLIETFGGASEDLVAKGFHQDEARTFAEKLNAHIHQRDDTGGRNS